MKLVRTVLVAALMLSGGIPGWAAAAAPTVRLTPSALTFGRENPEGPYPPQSATVRNNGDSPLVIANIEVENPSPSLGNDFTQTNNCYPFPRTLVAGESCTIQVGFFPGQFGLRQGAIIIRDNAPDNPQRLPLSGYSYPFKAMYTLDGFGGLHPDNPLSPPMAGGGYWPGWRIARAAVLLSDASGGYTLDGWGGLHAFGTAPPPSAAPYFGWDIARDVALLPGSTSTNAAGYVLDGWGGLHAFGGAPTVTGAPYWRAWDIAKRVKLLPDGSGGYVLDGWGALHPFGVGAHTPPRGITDSAYWPNWSIARDFDLFSNSTGSTSAGFTLDGFGGAHPFGFARNGPVPTGPYWGWDIARSIRLNPTSTTANPLGWKLEGFGGIHAFDASDALPAGPYWGWDIAVEFVAVR